MPESEKKNAAPSGIFISDEAIGGAVRRFATWVAKHFTRSILPVLITALGAGAGGYAAGNSSDSSGAHANLPASTTTAGPSATIVSPSRGASVARCTAIAGTATLSPGDRLWILVQAQDPQAYYLEGTATTSPATDPHVVDWNYQATIGANALSGQYVIYAVVTDRATSAFLSGILDGNNATPLADGLADKFLPPGVTAKPPVSVERVGRENSQCD
jgi:hypothetical protein